ncbi:MAG: hypothetical protein H7A51_07705 [Akkermansiaceae bacterium]|nr:hypothetical protein [Akkermansiaceae bacterium]
MKSLLILLLGVLFASHHMHAKQESSVSFRVTRFDPADRAAPEYQIADGTHIAVPMHNITKPLKATLRDGKFLDFFSPASDKKTPSISVSIPPDMRKNLLLIFVPSKDDYRVLKVHAPVDKLSGGSRLIVNATRGDLAIKYGNSNPVILKSSRNATFRGNGDKAMVPVLISQKTDTSWKLVRSERWPSDKRFRSFVFIYEKPDSHRIAVHAVPDRLPESE